MVDLVKLSNRVQSLGIGVEVQATGSKFVLGGCRLHVPESELKEDVGEARLLQELLRRYKGLLQAELHLVEEALDDTSRTG